MRFFLAFITLSSLAGCPGSRPTPPPKRMAEGCSDLPRNDMPRNDMPRNDMPRNDMPRNDMPRNGLTGAALDKNYDLLQALATQPFQQALDDLIARNLILPATVDDPNATRKLLKYIAACALDSCDHVSAGNATNSIELEGELGLCGDTYNTWVHDDPAHRLQSERTWKANVPSEGCKQRVSACVLARVNAVGASVRLSMRGDGMSLTKQVTVDTLFHENHGTPIKSFESCGSTRGDANRNCGWAPRHVGRCVTGDVTVRAPGRIRVCAGVYGCDDPVNGDITRLYDAATGAEILPKAPPRYGGLMLETAEDTVTFQCPTNGPLIGDTQTGYFAVMVDAATGPKVEVTQAQDPLAEYPASEASTFTYREGAFFGNLFDERKPEASPDQILWNDQFACFSDVWTFGEAFLADRLCAKQNPVAGECFGNTPASCQSRCQPLPGAPRVEDVCSGLPMLLAPTPRSPGFEPYTVYLNHPCDVATNYDHCISQMHEIPPPTN